MRDEPTGDDIVDQPMGSELSRIQAMV
jgi:hypothetical protein